MANKDIGELEKKVRGLEERLETLLLIHPLNLEDQVEVLLKKLDLVEKRLQIPPQKKQSLLELPFRQAAQLIGIPMWIAKQFGVGVTLSQVIEDARAQKLTRYRMIGPKSAWMITHYLKIGGFLKE